MAQFKNKILEKFLHSVFELGILVKAINGTIETVTGFLILFVRKNPATGIFTLNGHSLFQGRHDNVMYFFSHSLQNISVNTKTFVAIYILFHGVLNIFMTVTLSMKKLWAYIVSISFSLAFMTYQIYRISYNHSLFLAVVTLFDLFFVMLTWHEYEFQKELRNKK